MKEILDKNEWNQIVGEGSWNRFLQSWEWGEFQKKFGQVFRFARVEQDGTTAFAQVVEKKLPLGFKMWFVPRGPVRFSEKEYIELAKLAAANGAIMLRVEPDMVEKKNPALKLIKVASANPEVTLLTNLLQDEAQLLAAMHSKTRYNIRLAEKKGIKIHESKDANLWLKLHHETTQRDEFRGHPDSYYKAMLECPIAKLFVADYTDEAGITRSLAALIAIFFGDTVTYLHGASSNEAREVMAPHALHWHVMKRAKAEGYKTYDWWGMNSEDALHPAYKKSWEGITRFKRGFGGVEVQTPGTFEIPTRPFLYKLYAIRRALL